MMRSKWAIVFLPFGLVACDDGVGPGDPASVRIALAAAAPTQSSSSSASFSLGPAANQLVVAGSNGTLTITGVRMIVAEFELKRVERVDDCDASGTGNPCREFEAPPALVDLPLDGSEFVVATTAVPPGSYDELEFEIEDLEPDDDDAPATQQAIADLRAQLSAAFPGVPTEASMVVTGSFAPADGSAARPFTTFVKAEVEVELELAPALTIDDTGAADRTITVNLVPGLWFLRAGQAIDLSQVPAGELLELEVEVKSGLGAVKVKIDD